MLAFLERKLISDIYISFFVETDSHRDDCCMNLVFGNEVDRLVIVEFMIQMKMTILGSLAH
jgi:hypothetical protein